jgi:thiosulfate/3-mercaptopyruvate sulfurtransferase
LDKQEELIKMKLRILLLIVALVASAFAVTGSKPATAQTTPAEVIVSADWLEKNLQNEKVRVIEVSVIPGVFEKGHITGAVNFVWHTDFVDTVTRDVVSPERFQTLVRAAGINNDTTVVLYGDNNNWFAAWGAWIFHLNGFTNVRLLDGGRVKWEADGRALSTTAATYKEGNFTVGTPNAKLRAFKNDVLAIVKKETPGTLIDIRGAAEYKGEIFAPEGVQELSIRAGHIPGALNVPWGQNVNKDGTFKSKDELTKLYSGIGVDGKQKIVTYCRIGERAALTWFVLNQILGYDVALYDGSWTEWGNTVGLPIENPAGTVWGKR